MPVEIRWVIPIPSTAEQRAKAAEALSDVAENCLEVANRTIPIEEGTLQASGFAETDREALIAQVAYNSPYAVKQHEDPTLKHDAGRRDHWLEQTVIENADRWEQYIANAVS